MKIWVYMPRGTSYIEAHLSIDPILDDMEDEIVVCEQEGWEWDFRDDAYQPHISVDDGGGRAYLVEIKE